MTWAGARQTYIALIIATVVVIIAGVVLALSLYEAPTCTDGKKNQGEEGIDCGGACKYVCAASVLAPSVGYVRTVPGPSGRVDVVAYVENKNASVAAKDMKYEVELFGTDRSSLATREGTIDLPSGSGMLIFLPNVYSGPAPVSQAFLTFDEASAPWYSYEDERIIPRIEGTDIVSGSAGPRITAVVRNPSVETLRNVRFVVVVFDEHNTAIAASQTIVPEMPPQAAKTATFTWSEPFTGIAARVDVRPVIPLPDDE